MIGFSRKNFIVIILLAIFMDLAVTSCSKIADIANVDDNTKIVTLPVVCNLYGDDEVMSRSMSTPDTIRGDWGNGVTLEAIVSPEINSVESRAVNTIVSGSILVAVYSGTTLYKTLTASIANGVMSLELPLNKTIDLVFYADYNDATKTCTAPSYTPGSTTFDDSSQDLMFYKMSNVNITASTSSLSGFTFKHLFTRAKVTINSTQTWAKITAASLVLGSVTAHQTANINLVDGTFTHSGTPTATSTFTFTNPNGTSVSSDNYCYFISSGATGVLTISTVTFADATQTLKDITLNSTLENGKSYDIKISLTKYEPPLNTGFNGYFYQWDASYSYFFTSSAYNSNTSDPFGNYNNADVSSPSNTLFRRCPTYNQAWSYVNAGTFYVTNHSPVTIHTATSASSVTTVTSGVYMLKQVNISNFGGTPTSTSAISSKSQIDWEKLSITEKQKYFFLPAAGNRITSSYNNENTQCCYWLRTPGPINTTSSNYTGYSFDNFLGSNTIDNMLLRHCGLQVWKAD